MLLAFQPVHAATYTRGYALNSLNLPTTSSKAAGYAIDLNGDGHADNAFGALLSSLGSFGMDIPGATTTMVVAGQIVHLVELRSQDGAFTSDPAAEAIW